MLDTDAHGEHVDPSGQMQIGFFGNMHTPVTLFDGHRELMSGVWNANGEKMKIYEVSIRVRDDTSKCL